MPSINRNPLTLVMGRFNITLKLLQDFNACPDGIEFVKDGKLIGLEHSNFIENLISYDKLD